MEVGISTASFYPDALTEEAIPLIGELGARTIEVFLGGYSEYDEDFCKMVRERADKEGLNVYSVHTLSTQFEPQFFALTKRQRQDSRRLFEKVFRCARILGAKVYVFHGPPVRVKAKPNLNFQRIGKYTDELADMAGEYGLKFSWENVSWCWYAFPKFSHRLLEHTDSPNIYFTLDIKQAMQTGYDPMEFVEHMGKRLANIHAIDFDNDKRLTLPGRGVFDFNELAERLRAFNYRGPILLEVYRNNYSHHSDMAEALKFLNRIFGV